MKENNSDKRRFIRADFPCRIVIYGPQEHEIMSHTENIGAGGVRVIINEELNISSVVDLEVYLDTDPVKCKGRIVWVVGKVNPITGQPRMFDTGIEFYQISQENQEVINSLVKAIIEK